MQIKNTEHWTWIYNEGSPVKKESVKGKFLFYSDNKEVLIKLAYTILERFNLPFAKIPLSDNPQKSNSKGFGFVLCIYSKDDGFKYLMKKYASSTITYRWWKSNEKTNEEKVAKQFIANINPKLFSDEQ